MNPVSPATAHSPQASIRTTLLAGGAAPDFALALTAMLLPGGAKLPVAEAEIEPGAERQALAATGKDLPEALTEMEEKAGDDPGAEDLPFAWFAMPVLPVAAEPLGIQLPRPIGTIRLPEQGEAGATPELRLPGAALAETGFGAKPAEAIEAAAPAAADPAVFEIAEPTSVRPRAQAEARPADGPIRIELPLRATAPQVQPPAQLAATAAGPVQPVAAPLVVLQAAAELPGQPRRTTPRDLAAIAAPAAPGAEPLRPQIVAPVPDAQQPALDTRRHEWMASMIDRIDALRDSPGSRETSIRLSPDALGTVDVSIRHEGDRVHVRINAETPAARALLAEAQPRLAELAEARGIRLGQTSVEGGGAGQSGQPRHEAPRAQSNHAPASAAASEFETPSDERIA